jgi:hypothetical protein
MDFKRKATARPRPPDWRAERDRLDLSAVATDLLGPPPGRRGRRGEWWRCPLGTHRDDNPSFRVARDSAGRWRWRCFGCGGRGDAAALVMTVRDCSFPEAVAYLTGGSVGSDRSGRTSRPTKPAEAPPEVGPDPEG